MRAKIDLYRRLARLTTEAAVDDFASELADRFGPLPDVVAHLLELARLRIWAHGWGVQEIRLEDRYAVLAYTSQHKLSPLVQRARRAAARGRSPERLSAAGEPHRRSAGRVRGNQISLAAGAARGLESAAFLG